MFEIRLLLRWFAVLALASGTARAATNDSFANRMDLGSATRGVVPFDGRGATRQVGEPSHSSDTSTGSLWWRWTAPEDGMLHVKIRAGGADVSARRAVYTGPVLADLSRVGQTSAATALQVSVASGTAYAIAVATNSTAELDFEFFALPVNDAFESRSELGTTAEFTAQGSTLSASLQSGEPGGMAQGPSVWWTWQAPEDGLLSYDLAGSDSDYWNANLFSGNDLATLVKRRGRSPGQSAASPTVLRVKAGETFAIQVSKGDSGQAGRFQLNARLLPQPYQATPADSVDLGSVSSASGAVDNRDAVTEESSSMARLWWRWTAPAHGVFRWTATGTPGVFPQVAAYQADGTRISPHLNWEAFVCRAGETYLLSAETGASDAGAFGYRLEFLPSPANDALTGALLLEPGETSFDFTYTGVDPTEPTIPGYIWGRSLWWRWPAAADGALWLDFEEGRPQAVGAWGDDLSQHGISSPYDADAWLVLTSAGQTLHLGWLDDDHFGGGSGRFVTRFIPKSAGNDAFGAAADLGGGWNVAGYGDPAGATREVGEPMPATHGGSLWWKWTVPGNGLLRMRSRSVAPASNGLWLYRGGALGSLTRIEMNWDSTAAVMAGETLWVAVTGDSSGNAIPIAFELSIAPNDAFASAVDLGSVTAWQPLIRSAATSEAGEPLAQPSLWWKWTAPATGNVRFSVPSVNAQVSVYQGDALDNLTLLASASEAPFKGFAVTGGTTYRIAVTSSFGQPARLTWRWLPTPAGDLFSEPVDLGQAATFTLEPSDGGLMEPIETGLFPAGYDRSLWWRWTAPSAGKLAFDTLFESSWMLFEETGESGAGLTPVTDGWVAAGRRYRIANIQGPYQSTSTAVWSFHERLGNDDAEGAIDLGSATEATSGSDLYAATLDATESALLAAGSSPATHGVWWRWTAPFDGLLALDASSNEWSDASWVIQAADGAGKWLTLGTASGSSNQVSLEIAVKAGTVHRLLLGVSAHSAGQVDVTLRAWPAASNDRWQDAIDLGSEAHADATGDNTGALREAMEPPFGSGSVWWKWTAPVTCNAYLTTRIGGNAVMAGVYQRTGAQLSAVPAVATSAPFSGGTTLGFRTVAGTTYWFSVSGADQAAVGKVELALRAGSVPVNDDYAGRIALASQLPVAFSGNTGGSTIELGEIVDDGFGSRAMSLWWSWTAPTSGPVSFSVSGGAIAHVLTGSTLATLTPVKRVSGAVGGWIATAGTTYQIVVSSYDHPGTTFHCELGAAALPGNDAFANRLVLGAVAQGSWEGENVHASAEPGEPAHAGRAAARSVWFDWTAPDSSGVLVSAVTGGFQGRVGIYTGSAVSSLQTVASGTWKVAFKAVAGQTYRLAIDGAEGGTTLSLQPLALPANDLFANRIPLEGWPIILKGNTLLADKETGEPGAIPAISMRSLWWQWRAPVSTTVNLATESSDTANWTVYSSTTQASGFNSLSQVATGNRAGSFSVIAGRYYYFRVHHFGAMNFTWDERFEIRIDRSPNSGPAPANDDFANRIDLGNQAGVRTTGDFRGTTIEAGETGTTQQGSLWWSWTAPAEGVFLLSRNSTANGTMSIHTGSDLAALVTVASGTGSREWFRASAGTIYQIRAMGSSVSNDPASRFTQLEIVSAAAPANDAFAEATAVPDSGAAVEGYNAGGGAEAGEPAYSGGAARASVWYHWTAVASGSFRITTSSATMRAGVYQGATLASLVPVAAGNTSLNFTAAAGETYRIALDSNGDETFQLRVSPLAPAISNDAFASATPLVGAAVSVAGTTVGATLEADEPYHTGSTSQGGSAWWTWTAPADGAVGVSATATSVPHLAVYQGTSLGTLELIASGSRRCRFQAVAGTVYRIAVSSTNTTGSTFDLALEQAGDGPGNDSFANAQIFESNVLVDGTLAGASLEAGETWHGASDRVLQSVWYRWTAPRTGRARVSLASGNPGTLAIYRGTRVDGLSHVVTSSTTAGLDVVAGEEFHILVGLSNSQGELGFGLEAGMLDVGGNDAFAGRIDLGSDTAISWSATMEQATLEVGETPMITGAAGSRWWSWTAPADGGVTLDLEGSRIRPSIFIYTGGQLTSLGMLASTTSSWQLSLPVVGGTTYQIALRGVPDTAGIGDVGVNLRFQVLPNDRQPHAIDLGSELPASGGGSLAGASSELGEAAGMATLWWKWTSPISGIIELDASATEFSVEPTMWTGTRLPGLQPVIPTRSVGALRRFPVVAGTTYWVSVGTSQDSALGEVRFTLRRFVPVTNDAFADALTITGEAFTIDVAGEAATAEAGEPVPRSVSLANFYTRSLWWRWTAPRDGLLRLSASGGWAFVYEGPGLQQLREVAGPGPASSTSNGYWVVAGREYWIAAGHSSGGRVAASFKLSPPGDSFADAVGIAGAWVKRSGSLAEMTWEAGEPFHAGVVPQSTLWFRWTAPSSGTYRVMAKSVGGSLRAAAYSGAVLSEVAESGSGNGEFTFVTMAGQEYRIAINGGSVPADFLLVLAKEIPAYSAWREGHFDFDEPASAPDSDPDHDGLVNQVEASLGLDPRAFTPGPVFTHDDSEGRMRLHLRRAAGGHWKHSFDLSPNLMDWRNTGSMSRHETIEDHGDGTETLHLVLLDEPAGFHPSLFIRLCTEPAQVASD
jgi:hypothetical protein